MKKRKQAAAKVTKEDESKFRAGDRRERIRYKKDEELRRERLLEEELSELSKEDLGVLAITEIAK